ncbi:MAG TPA: hypothetical protein P5080_01310 [Candidatus Paceibacterota bacterium]|nr:hypothetical protein [Candidatus Pacearchaeota archaeon]HRZ50772.1 hypothetical protein [Candidatus Paceibacterota bacterium]HSA36331.1 hypothetical protein [Candidatus Paceibacterota bacterium]
MNGQKTKLTLVEEFLTIYNELDSFMRKQLRCRDASHIFLLDRMAEKNYIFRNFREELKEYARLRNAIVHNPFMRIAEPIAEPHFEIVRRYQTLKDKILNPPRAMSIAVGVGDIYATALDANALETMKVMNEKIYSFVPVLNIRKRIVGVFSENVIFSYLTENEACIIDKSTKISEFWKYVPIEKHSSEYFEFVPKNTLVAGIKEKFEIGLTQRKRLGVVYITDNGRSDGLLLGMITAWDMAGNE